VPVVHRSHALTNIPQCSKALHIPLNSKNREAPGIVGVHRHRKGSRLMIITLVLKKLRKWLDYQATVRELEGLDDRDLSDLGIGRSDIRSIARESTR
jgi:uncharacterized protein YjiS (DUF1127 family)